MDNESSAEVVSQLRECMYDVLSPVDYGDLSDIDIPWTGLVKKFLELPFKYSRGIGKNPNLSVLLKQLSEDDTDISESLVDVCRSLEEKLDLGSNDSVEEEELDKIRNVAMEFEEAFSKLLETLDSRYES